MDGDEQEIERLLPHKRLIYSIIDGDMKEFAMRLAQTNPKNEDSHALRVAADFERLDMVRILLPVSDANASECAALRMACYNCNQEIFDVLYPYCDPHIALARFKRDGGTNEEMHMLLQRIKSDEERQTLNAALHSDKPHSKRKM